MSGILINSGVNNYGGVPLIGANTAANRPTARIRGRLFVDTTNNLLQYDTGAAWVTIGSTGPTGSGASGQATFWTGASTISGDNAFFWNNTNKRLGLGTVSPSARLDIHGVNDIFIINATADSSYMIFQTLGSNRYRFGVNNISDNLIFQNASSVTVADISQTGVLRTISNSSLQQVFSSAGLTQYNNFFGQHWFIPQPKAGLPYELENSQIVCMVPYGLHYEGTTQMGGVTIGAAGFPLGFDSPTSFFVNTGTQAGQGNWGFGTESPTTATKEVKFGASTSPAIGGDVTSTITAYNQTIGMFSSCQFNVNGLNLLQGRGQFISRVNVNNATDNALFELNVNGNTYTGGISPTILTVTGNTTMARTATGYYCTATCTLTLPSAASINNIYWVIAGSGVTVTVNRAGSDDILNLAGASVTSITISPNQRAMFYVGGGTRTFLIFQA